MSKATKTVKKKVEQPKRKWFVETKKLYNETVAFYFAVLQAHPEVLEKSSQKALRVLEILTHKTKKNPNPLVPLPFLLPAMFRRAAINTAFGAAQSFFANLKRFEKSKSTAAAKGVRVRERPPHPPRTWNFSPVFYQGLSKGFREKEILLRLHSGTSWHWMRFRLSGPTIEPKSKVGSPHAVFHGQRIELHFPVEKEIPKVEQLEKQVQRESFALCAVDLNISEHSAVCAILKSDGTQITSRFFGGGTFLNGRRKRLLGKIAQNRRATGSLGSDEQDNKAFWEKIRNIEDYEAHRLSRRIVQFSQKYVATAIVFEHLGNFKPLKGKYSRRGNEKRSYWLRGRIFHYTKYKAWEEGIITSRVNPRYTSQLCASCARDGRSSHVERHTEKHKDGYIPGAPLFSCCASPLHKGNADLNAANNIGLRLLARYSPSLNFSKPTSKEGGVCLSYTTAG